MVTTTSVALIPVPLSPDPAQRQALDEARRLLTTSGPRLLRLQAQQQAALQLLQARRLGATDRQIRQVLDGIIHHSLVCLARR